MTTEQEVTPEGDPIDVHTLWLDFNDGITNRGEIMKLTALAAVAVLALAGCSTAKGTTAAPAAAPLTLAQVATKAGCVGTPTPSSQVGTTGGAMCTKGDRDVYFYTFADDSARDNWLSVARAAGALGSFQQGTSWVIQTL